MRYEQGQASLGPGVASGWGRAVCREVAPVVLADVRTGVVIDGGGYPGRSNRTWRRAHARI